MKLSNFVDSWPLLAVFVVGCGAAGEDELSEDRSLAASQQALYQAAGSTLWAGGVMPVCWTPATVARADFATFSARVRRVVEDNWGRVAQIKFTGWGTCSATPNGIYAIEMSDATANSDANGFGSFTGLRTMRFGLDRNNDGVILHEFGHGLGFAHEMDRSNFTSEPGCPHGSATTGNPWGTPPDPASIMTYTYCASNTTPALSPWDIVGIQNAYGRKSSGSIVGSGGRCLDVPGAVTTNADLQIYDCNAGAANQKWLRQANDGLLATISGQNRCVDIKGGTVSPTQGTLVQSYSCTGNNNQKFTFSNVQILGMGNKCLDVPNGDFTSHQYVQLYTCNAGVGQNWTVNSDGSIQAGGGGMCLDVPGGVGSSGLDLQLYPCTGAANQKFTFTSAGEIKFGSLCVDTEWGDPVNGRRLQLYTCGGSANQRYSLRGAIHGLGQCLDLQGGATVSGTKAQVYPCNGGANQTFDYYF